MCGFIAQLVEDRTGRAALTGLTPVETLIISGLLLSNCLNWEIYCDNHSLLSFPTLLYLVYPKTLLLLVLQCSIIRIKSDSVIFQC